MSIFAVMEDTLLYCGKLTPTRGWHIDRHSHPDFHEFIFVLQGKIKVRIQGKNLEGGAGSFLCYPRCADHSEEADGEEPLETFFLGIKLSESNKFSKAIAVFDREGRLRTLTTWIYKLRLEHKTKTTSLQNHLTAAILEEFLRLAEPEPSPVVQMTQQFIEEHFKEEIKLPDLAKACDLSVSRFSHAFKNATGTTPADCLRRRRMDHARTLLLSTPLPLKTIAQECGCADEFVLSKTFRRIMGVNPSSIRN